MKQTIFKRGTPINEKRIAWIERVVTRLTRRTKSMTSVAMTPYPISNCVVGDKVSGVILRYMFCASGDIGSFMVCLDSKPKKNVKVSVLIEDKDTNKSSSFVMTTKQLTSKINIEINAGERLTVSIDSYEESINEVWTAFLWVPKLKEANVKSFLIDDLEDMAEKNLIEEQEPEDERV